MNRKELEEEIIKFIRKANLNKLQCIYAILKGAIGEWE